MAFVFSDGMDSYAVTADIAAAGKWPTVGATWVFSGTAGRNGGGGLQVTSQVALVSKSTILAAAEACYGFWLKVSAIPGTTTAIFAPLDVNGNFPTFNLLQIVTGTGFLRMTLSGSNLTGNINVCDNQWHWIELDTETVIASSSTQICYCDAVQQWSTTTATTSTLTQDRFEFVGMVGVTMTVDDVICWNDTAGGPTFSSFPLGPREITTLRPTSDGTVQFTTSTGSDHFALIDETVGSTTDYVQDGVSGDQDLYGYSNLSTTPAVINAVMVNGYMLNPNPGTINFQQICNSNATQANGASTIAPTSVRVMQTQFAVDPDGSAAWGATGLNAAQFGIKVV